MSQPYSAIDVIGLPDAPGHDEQVCGNQDGRISDPQKRSLVNGRKWSVTEIGFDDIGATLSTVGL